MTIYDEMRGYVHAHDWNGWFDVETETGPMYQMIDKAQAENDKLRELCTALYKCCDKMSECETCEDVACPFMDDCRLHDRMCELGVEL